MSIAQSADLSDLSPTSLYLHIPFCKSKCSYCNFYSEPVSTCDTSALISAMIKEIESYRPDLVVSTIYIGGGTPTCIGDDQLCTLINALKQHFESAGSALEFTVEANPNSVTGKLLKQLRDLGVNRLSIGAQSFDKSELSLLGRTHRPEEINTAVSAARNAGFSNIAMDLIFAIPNSTIETLKHSLQRAIELSPTHISAYSLTYEPDTPLYRAKKQGSIVAIDEETDRQMYELTIATLTAAGYEQYEISNFARPSFQCAHNQTYWANKPYIGIGPSAGAWFENRRSTNLQSIDKYITVINNSQSPVAESNLPNPIEIACETAVLNLRRIAGIDIAQYKMQTGFDIFDLFKNEIDHNQKLGLLKVGQQKITLTQKALPIADSVMADFSTI